MVNPESLVATGVPADDRQRSFLVLGATLSSSPVEKLDYQWDSCCAGIILLGKVEPAELEHALARVADPAVPIADFGDNTDLRRDFVGTHFGPAVISQLEENFSPI